MIKFSDWAEELPNDMNGFRVIRIIQGEYTGIEYVYGGVSFEENDDDCKIVFGFTITNGAVENLENFKLLIGDILVAMIDKQLIENDVVYSGGK